MTFCIIDDLCNVCKLPVRFDCEGYNVKISSVACTSDSGSVYWVLSEINK
jgi:hypothetical protein